ncbi:MAG: transporter suffix domain-containing protein [Syntrophomonas sp.]
MIANNQDETASKDHNVGRKKWLKILGFVLVAFSFSLYFVILPVPFTPFPIHIKGLIFVILVIIKDICLGLGIVILGKEYLVKYFKYLHVFDWLKEKFNKR